MANKLFGLLLAALLTLTPSFVEAGDVGKMDQNTIVAVSIDDWQGMISSGKESSFSQFMEEPSVKEIWDRLFNGFSKMMSAEISLEESDSEAVDFLKNLLSRWYAENTGSWVLGIGYAMDPNMGFPMPNLLLDFNGPEDLGEPHRELLTLIRSQLEGQEPPMIPTAFSIGEMEFNGLEAMPGVGIFIGQQETRHVVGTSRAALNKYLSEGDTAVGGNFSTTKVYKSAQNQLRRGSESFFVNLDALWNLVPLAQMMMGAGGGDMGGPSISEVLAATGIDSVSGMAIRSYTEDGGSGSDTIVAMEGRKGLMSLIPTENGDIRLPDFVSDKSMNVSLIRLQFDNIVESVVEMVAVLEGSDPDEMRAMLDIQMEMMSGELGFDPREMLDAMEGSIVLASPAADDNAPLMQNPMEMMMGQSTSGNFMIRMRDRKVFDKILDVMTGPEMMGAMVKKDTFMDLDVWTYDPLGDMPPEFAGQGPALAPSWTMTDDWLVIAMSNDDLKEMIRSSKGEGRKFMDNPEIKKVLAQVQATSGMSIGFTDVGENFATAANVLRPLLGFLPLMAGELAQDENLLFLFDPSNIPESDLFRKYFGWAASRVSIVEDGVKIYSFSEWPAKDGGAGSDEEKKEAKKEPVRF